MTHMHIPDGVLPVRIWLLGFLVMFITMAISLIQLRSRGLKRKIPLLGAVSAAMLVVMSLEILPIVYHINLSVVAGIPQGTALGFLATFITNPVLAFMRRSGVMVIGLNTLLLGAEAIRSHNLFFVFPKRLPVFWRAAVATVLTLFITTIALIGIVASSHLEPDLFSHEQQGHGLEQLVVHKERLSVSRFATMVLILGSVGWIIEAAITGAVVSFKARVKPDLLGQVFHPENARRSGGLRGD
jgi:cobalt/nickel transport system permease protein